MVITDNIVNHMRLVMNEVFKNLPDLLVLINLNVVPLASFLQNSLNLFGGFEVLYFGW